MPAKAGKETALAAASWPAAFAGVTSAGTPLKCQLAHRVAELDRSVSDARDVEDLKRLGAGRPAPEGVTALYREAFRAFGAAALWSRTPSEHPTVAQALAVAESLRREGDMRSRSLAARIEAACRAAV